jgi:3-hydroxyacyl-CoA dehydrogenase
LSVPTQAFRSPRSPKGRRRFRSTGRHPLFNPPRYLHLLEVIPTPETKPDVVETVSHFADHRLGKGVVIAKDSPNFVGNHIGLYAMMRILAKVASGDYTIDEVDAITGPPLGRPKSATFRTLDLAGLDILGHVVNNLRERLGSGAGRDVWTLPPFFVQMSSRADWREGGPGSTSASGSRTASRNHDRSPRWMRAKQPTVGSRMRRRRCPMSGNACARSFQAPDKRTASSRNACTDACTRRAHPVHRELARRRSGDAMGI